MPENLSFKALAVEPRGTVGLCTFLLENVRLNGMNRIMLKHYAKEVKLSLSVLKVFKKGLVFID